MLTSTALLISVLGLFVLLFVLSPFFSKKRKVTASPEATDGELQKELVFAHLSDLEYDYHMDKVTERDYIKAKEELMVRAAPYLEAEKTNLQLVEQEVDEELERYLQDMKGEAEKGARHEN
jgi:hypothetical protein